MKQHSIFSLPFLLVALWLGACASSPQQPPVPALDLAAPLPAVAARFVTQRIYAPDAEAHDGHNAHAAETTPHDLKAVSSEWLFWRSAQRVEMTIPGQQSGEAWWLDGKALFYQKLFHADKKIVEYQQADLEGLAVATDLRSRQLLLEPQVLQQLTVRGQRWQDGHPLLELEGTVNQIAYRVDWRTDLNLPQYLRKQDARGNRETTRLRQVQPLAQATVTPPDSQGYDVIDYADLGDRERDPFVIRIQQQLPGGDVHHH